MTGASRKCPLQARALLWRECQFIIYLAPRVVEDQHAMRSENRCEMHCRAGALALSGLKVD